MILRRAAIGTTASVVVVAVVVIIGTTALVVVTSQSVPPATPTSSGGKSATTSCAVTTTNGLGQKSTFACANQTSVSPNSTQSDTFLTRCSVTEVGGFQLRVISDSTGAAVSGATINATDILGCDIVGQAAETQVVYLDDFSAGQGGWITPVFPAPATPGGELNFTVTYQGGTFHFSAGVPPIGTSCVTLHVPSGNVTGAATMNGPCSLSA